MKHYVIDLKGKVVESGNIYGRIPFIDRGSEFALDRFFVLKEKLINRKKTRKILFKMHPDFTAYVGQLEEIYRCLQDLKKAGKELYFYAKTYGLKELYLASACQHRVIPPDGAVVYYGYSLGNVYFKNLMDSLNIQADVYRVGKYKGAADPFRVSSMDDAQKEAYSLILNRMTGIMEDTVRENLDARDDFHKLDNDVDFIEELKGGTFYQADKALARGLVTQTDYWYNLARSWNDHKVKRDKVKIKKLRAGRGYRIAVLSFDGNIVDGTNRKHPLMGSACGDEFYVEEISKLAAQKSVKAVIFKVNSGGGSASASAEIASALEKLKEKKPLVVVQSGIAGSGGYYVSFPGEKIFTQHSTITGSIGVINLLFYTGDFMEKHGITHSNLKDGEYADLVSPWRRRGEREGDMIMEHIKYVYHTFTAGVAKNRNMAQEAVDKIGQGRVWPGCDAVEIKICDEIGGLGSAVDYLTKKQGVDSASLEFFPKPKKGLLNKLLRAGKGEGMDILDTINMPGMFKELNGKPLCYMEELLTLDFRW